MADDNKKPSEKEEVMVPVPQSVLEKLQSDMLALEQKVEEGEARNAGLEELFNSQAEASGEKTGLKKRKDFTPKFRTVRVRKYPIAGDITNMGVVTGWSDRGAYQEVDGTGITRQYVDFIDIFFHGQEKTKNGKTKAEKIKLLDLINNGPQITCKILEVKKEEKVVETGEEIGVSTFDPQHGMISTGETVDGYWTYSDTQVKVDVPGVGIIWLDAKFVNQ